MNLSAGGLNVADEGHGRLVAAIVKLVDGVLVLDEGISC